MCVESEEELQERLRVHTENYQNAQKKVQEAERQKQALQSLIVRLQRDQTQKATERGQYQAEQEVA